MNKQLHRRSPIIVVFENFLNGQNISFTDGTMFIHKNSIKLQFTLSIVYIIVQMMILMMCVLNLNFNYLYKYKLTIYNIF